MNISFILSDKNLAQKLVVLQNSIDPAFQNGELVPSLTPISVSGVPDFSKRGTEEFQEFGALQAGEVVFYIKANADGTSPIRFPDSEDNIGDFIIWNNNSFIVKKINDFSQYGYYVVVAERRIDQQ